jgi:hypothetical protein
MQPCARAFNTTEIAYAKCQKHIEKCMNDYYFGVQNLRLAGRASHILPATSCTACEEDTREERNAPVCIRRHQAFALVPVRERETLPRVCRGTRLSPWHSYPLH